MHKHPVLTKIERWPLGPVITFAIRQAWAALFGGLLIAGLVITAYVDLPWLARYDWLFMWALFVQIFMLALRLERPHEVATIAVFHAVGLGMEVFKTAPGIASWTYPGASMFHVAAVPLFSGFMYAAVGSYIARAWRVFGLRFTNYPKRWLTVLLAAAIYVNFFSHHFIPDARWVLIVAVVLIFGRSWVIYHVNGRARRMPLVVGFGLIASVIYLAENIATFTRVWLYPSQVAVWHPVGISKFGSWFLLMIISFVLVDLLHFARRDWYGD